jgi:hypothetical protein
MKDVKKLTKFQVEAWIVKMNKHFIIKIYKEQLALKTRGKWNLFIKEIIQLLNLPDNLQVTGNGKTL